jgi:serine/threonine protein kinase
MAAERAKSTETASAAKAHLDNALVLLRSARADADRLRRVEAELRAVYGQQDNYEQYIQRQVSVLNPSYVKIADFGVALMAMDTANGGERTAGTPRYMAPEQIQGKALDGRCDIFSLGVVAFEMLTGRVTFEVEHKTEYLRLNCNEDIAPITAVDPSLPQEVGRIVQQMTARDREARYSAADLIADIEAAQMATTALA